MRRAEIRWFDGTGIYLFIILSNQQREIESDSHSISIFQSNTAAIATGADVLHSGLYNL
jgi:hypothetical protein